MGYCWLLIVMLDECRLQQQQQQSLAVVQQQRDVQFQQAVAADQQRQFIGTYLQCQRSWPRWLELV